MSKAMTRKAWLEYLKKAVDDFDWGADYAEAEKQEPVAWMHKQGNHEEPSFRQLDDWEIGNGWTQYPLYTHPHPKREPLTDEQAQEVRIKAYSRDIDSDMALIRETEAAHGIKGEA